MGPLLIAERLLPGIDLRTAIVEVCSRHHLQAVSIVSAVGSLREVHLRLADARSTARITGPLEIVSLTGTVSSDGPHLHIAVADSNGDVSGGHLLLGSPIHTTVELTLLEATALVFKRTTDPVTGYAELHVQPRPPTVL